MAFTFAAAMGDSVQSGLQVHDGEELKEIQTGQLGFKTINGDVKVRLLPTAWPSDSPPIPSAQLLSIASSQSILAAADPDNLIIASTDEVRQILGAKEGDNARDLRPILSIPHSRLSHIAFTSDESVLLVFGPSTNGILVYQVDTLKKGQTDVAMRISIPSLLRSLVPNPNSQSAHLIAIVSTDGELSIANLRTGQLVQGSAGTTLGKETTCVAWSNRGKQLVAGNASGTAIQLKPDGTVAAHIPKSTSVQEDSHVSTISWLEDDIFFITYTPNSIDTDQGIPASGYYIVERKEKTQFTFHKFPMDIVAPFGVERLPTHHFVARLRKFDPHITDLLLVAATSATDIGIVSKSAQPLSSSEDPEQLVVNQYTLTSLEDDTRRAALPLSSTGMLDTSPIGMAIDLSSKESVINPLPSDPEIQETDGPVPNLLVLNNEGLLSSWWVIYTDSIKEKTMYSGFEILKKANEIRSAKTQTDEMDSTTHTPEANPVPAEAESSLASPFTRTGSAFPATTSSSSMFGGSSAPSAFGTPKLQPSWSSVGTGPSFGSISKIGDDKPSWTSTGFSNDTTGTKSGLSQAAFGQPSFGTPSTMSSGNGPAFGTSTFGKPAGLGQPTAPAFGQTGFGSGSAASPFAAAGAAKVSSPFASFANSSGFGNGTAPKNDKTQSPFGVPPANSGFSSFANIGGFGVAQKKQDGGQQTPFGQSNTFGSSNNSNAFGSGQGFSGFGDTASKSSQSAFGSGQPFKMQSTFKGDGTAKDDLPAPTGGSDAFGLGSLLNDTKTDVAPTRNVEAEMDESDDQAEASRPDKETPFGGFSPDHTKSNEGPKHFITPPATIAQSKATPTPAVSNLFGFQQQPQVTPQPNSTGFSFTSTTPKDTPAPLHTLFGSKPFSTTPAAVQKSEPTNPFGVSQTLPNDGTQAKPAFARAETESKPTTKVKTEEEDVDLKSIPEAPLPPDPAFASSPVADDSITSSPIDSNTKDAPLPPDFLPANASAVKAASKVNLPEDDGDEDEDAEDEEDDGFSELNDSGEDVTQDMSPTEGVEGDDEDGDEDATTEHVETSPESSFKGADTTSPTGGLFTKISAPDATRPARPLFGEVGRSVPMFPPPKPHQSPRSPSPVRPFATHNVLRPDNRSVSAPLNPRSAIEQRKAEYSQSAIAAQAAKAREEETARERARLAAAKSAAEKTRAEESLTLEDDADERIQRELALPVQPSNVLDEFITYQAGPPTEGNKPDIAAQIERLYQDINSMIYTTGINARSLSAFIMHEKAQRPTLNWPSVLNSDAPMDAVDQSWSLNAIDHLRDSNFVLQQNLKQAQLQAVQRKLESCQSLLTTDLFELRTKITAIRKSIHARANGLTASAPLSAEQASIQHDLRKASASVQTKLVQIEDTLVIMRTKLAEVASQTNSNKSGTTITANIQKKPTVEAVTNTVVKMTSMAEKKSADIDVLEAQLKKLDASLGNPINGTGQPTGYSTPRRFRTSRTGGTPASAASSMFYTPDSKAQVSARSTRSTTGHGISSMAVSTEDKDRWQVQAARKKEVAATLRTVLEDRRKKMLTSDSM